MTEKTEIKRCATMLNANLKFGFMVDMTDFEDKELKAGEYQQAKKDYIESKLPDENTVKQIFEKAQKDLEELGFDCLKVNVYSDMEPKLDDFIPSLIEDVLKGITPPPQY